ncbi:MAG: OmpH family outer membrane protein [bacterium]|nr:OmpH family outer membrane protein [bacterium]
MALACAAALGGCARVDVHAPNVRGIAYVRMDEVMKHHPLHAQLAQLQDSIAAINLEATLPHEPLSAAQIAAQTKDLKAQFKTAEDRAGKAIAALQQTYAQKEHDADVAAAKAAGVDPAAIGIGAAMSAQSQAQAESAAQAAAQGYVTYQQSVVAQDAEAMKAISAQLSKQADQKLRARVEQYQQDESDLSLRLAQQDAPERIALKTKLNNLALDPAARKSVQSQISAIDKKESAQVSALHAQHEKALDAYRAQVAKETNAEIAKQTAAIRDESAAKINARRVAVGAQLRSLGGPPVPTQSIPPQLAKSLGQIHQQLIAQYQTDAQKIASDFSATQDDLNRQFEALHGADVGATGAAAKELKDLQQRHDALQQQMIAQIQSEAKRIASEMGFSVVLDSVDAAPGGYDLTNDLIHDVESLHE